MLGTKTARAFSRSIGLAALLLAWVPTWTDAQTLPAVSPGDGRIDGAGLSPHSAVWSQSVPQGEEWVVRAEITEELTQSGEQWVRTQRTRQGPVELIVEVELDRQTLRPLSLRRYFGPDVPEEVTSRLGQAGFVAEIEIDFGEHDYVVRTLSFGGTRAEARGDMGMPYFDASTLGLLFAAMDVGAGVRFPALFVNASDGAVTEYWIEASPAASAADVSGTEAVQLDIAWYDSDGTIVSEPGPDAAGGAYWIATQPDHSSSPILRYKNESVDIVIREEG